MATVARVRKRDLKVVQEIVETRGGFGHREHLELAWNYLRHYSIDEATEAMVAAIRHIARLHGEEEKFHETITRAWLHFVAVHMQRWGADNFEEFLERNADLLDSKLIRHFYSRELILSDAARALWTAPDLRGLPALA
jgi:N-formylglutamate deformylase